MPEGGNEELLFNRYRVVVLKEISPEYPLEGLMMKLKLQNVGHLMERATHWKRP